MEILEPLAFYGNTDDNRSLLIINLVRKGIGYDSFHSLAGKSRFTMDEWSSYLHLSERSMQRYRKEKKAFDPVQSEKIMEIALLFNKGIVVFGDAEKFSDWLSMENLALGNIKPKSLLDSTFGINLVSDELTRIENGVLA
jgi:putative toxin-antitoxin system antitoxin component (TIGR02293 family)